MVGRELDEERLASLMKVFASPVRVELLQLLTRPHALGEIRLAPRRTGGAAMSRQAVSEHLQMLVAAGAVRQWEAERDGRTVQLYQVHHAQLFALTESLRDLGRIQPDGPAVLDGTVPQPRAEPPRQVPGPGLLALNGAREGTRFPLRGRGPWRIGRAAGMDVCLDYDPFLSLENTEVELAPGGAALVRTLPRSRNGTTVNWAPVPAGEAAEVRAGDVIGVGRTLLLWKPA